MFMKDIKKLKEHFLKKTKKKMKEIISREDLFLMHIERVITDLEKVLNILGERLSDWYAIYFPELKIEDKTDLAQLVIISNENKEFDETKLKKFLSKKKIEKIKKLASKSIGSHIKKEHLEYMKSLANMYLSTLKLKEYYEKEIEMLANSICPNATYLIGGKLTAKFINLAHGLDKLASLPASTIQLLGAEKALFKYLRRKKKGKPPKHGIILFTKYVSTLPKSKRGKMARTLASKLSIAFKLDYGKSSFMGKELKKYVEKRYKELQSSSK